AGGVLAVLAEHGLEVGAGVCGGAVALVVGVDADPVHLAAGEDLVLADDGDVVLGLAGDDARAAAGADVEVHDHAPGVAVVDLAAGHGGVEGEVEGAAVAGGRVGLV